MMSTLSRTKKLTEFFTSPRKTNTGSIPTKGNSSDEFESQLECAKQLSLLDGKSEAGPSKLSNASRGTIHDSSFIQMNFYDFYRANRNR